MADWVHCNMCFHQPGDGKQYRLTNCGHIYCEDCFLSATKDKCKMCGNVCTAITLSSKMKPDVEMFFCEPSEFLKKQHKQILQLFNFQKNHRQRLCVHLREQAKKNEALLVKTQKWVDRCTTLEREVMVLRDENAYLKKLVKTMDSGSSNRSVQKQSCSPSPTSGSYSSQPRKSPNDANRKFYSLSYTSNQMSHVSGHRISIRTPPSNGVIPCGERYRSVRSDSSPMQLSPAASMRSGGYVKEKSPLFGTPGTFLAKCSSTPTSKPIQGTST